MKSFKPFKIATPKISLAVLGSGSWATALVKILTDSGIHVHWYVRNPQQAQIIKTTFILDLEAQIHNVIIMKFSYKNIMICKIKRKYCQVNI